MKSNTRIACGIMAVALFIMAAVFSFADSPVENEAKEPVAELTVAEARRHAKLLHNTYAATLHTVHREYFRESGRTPIPARVLEEVFYWVDEETHGETRWISVNTEAMSIEHNPKTDFEKEAAKVLATGKEEFEKIEDGMYRRAGAIKLFASCLKCHESALTQSVTRRRVAGLVISIPCKAE